MVGLPRVALWRWGPGPVAVPVPAPVPVGTRPVYRSVPVQYRGPGAGTVVGTGTGVVARRSVGADTTGPMEKNKTQQARKNMKQIRLSAPIYSQETAARHNLSRGSVHTVIQQRSSRVRARDTTIDHLIHPFSAPQSNCESHHAPRIVVPLPTCDASYSNPARLRDHKYKSTAAQCIVYGARRANTSGGRPGASHVTSSECPTGATQGGAPPTAAQSAKNRAACLLRAPSTG